MTTIQFLILIQLLIFLSMHLCSMRHIEEEDEVVDQRLVAQSKCRTLNESCSETSCCCNDEKNFGLYCGTVNGSKHKSCCMRVGQQCSPVKPCCDFFYQKEPIRCSNVDGSNVCCLSQGTICETKNLRVDCCPPMKCEPSNDVPSGQKTCQQRHRNKKNQQKLIK